jgi:hypothetical protein
VSTNPLIVLRAGALVAGLALVGCAHGEPPRAELAVANTKISDAERAGAAEHAPTELDSARHKLNAAEDAVRDERYDDAQRLASEAEADASLAEARSRAAVAQASANAVQRDIGTLQQEAMPAPLSGAAGHAPAGQAPVGQAPVVQAPAGQAPAPYGAGPTPYPAPSAPNAAAPDYATPPAAPAQ